MFMATLGYYKVVKENENLHNKVQVLKGDLEKTLKIVDVSAEEEELQKELLIMLDANMRTEIAVNRLSKESRQGLDMSSKMRFHLLPNFSTETLRGFLDAVSCIEDREMLWIYEYMPNNSLGSLIFGTYFYRT